MIYFVVTTTDPCRHRTSRRRFLTKFDSWFVDITVVLDGSNFWKIASRRTWRWTINQLHHLVAVVIVFKSDVSIITAAVAEHITVWFDHFVEWIRASSSTKLPFAFFFVDSFGHLSRQSLPVG